MTKKIGIIGGDLRIIRLAEILGKEKHLVFTYALEKYSFLSENVIKSNSIKNIINECYHIISGIPITKDGIYLDSPFSDKKIEINKLLETIENKNLIAGGINEKIKEKANNKNVKVTDLLNIEELTILNAIPTVEGAIETAIENTEFTLNGSNCLILGFGRIGKLLAKSLHSLGANVFCMARKESDIAWIKAYRYNEINIDNFEENLNKKYDIIFNTVPAVILNRRRLELLKDCKPLIIELASKPWGEDFEAAEEFKIKIIKAQGLPGKVAPLTSAINIKKVLDNIIKL